MGSRLRSATESFWFIPAVFVVSALVLAQAAVTLEAALGEGLAADVPDQWRLGVDGSRGLLTTIGGSMLAVAGTTFSITISVIATASSTYGPRLVRNFMADRRNQAVLGLFVSTFVYCLMVLRSVTSADESTGEAAFVPYLGTYLALLIAIADVAALVYFLHHTAQSVQVDFLIGRVRRELEQTVSRLYADVPDSAADVADVRRWLHDRDVLVRAEQAGFVVSLDPDAVVAAARDAGTVAVMAVHEGSHVLAGEPIALLGRDDAMLRQAVLQAVEVGDTRRPGLDIGLVVQQMIEMAVRALSPGTNDPYTARTVLNEMADALCVIAEHPRPPAGRTDADGQVRLVLRIPTGEEVIGRVLEDMVTHGTSDPLVVRATIDLAARLHRRGSPAVQHLVRARVDGLVDAYASGGAAAGDVAVMRRYATSAMHPESELARVVYPADE
jgi:uncharacterized membrane protein